MTYLSRGFGLAATLALIFSLGVVPTASAQSTSAYVYVQSQGPAGPVYGYSADSTGHLTAISGSPFKPGTAIVGSNGSQFFTLGHTLLHSWAVGSNGAIGAQLSQIGMMNYNGGSCGGTAAGDDGAVLDHTGKTVFVLLQYGGDWSCSAYQTYKVNSDGSFTYIGVTEEGYGSQSGVVNPTAVDVPSTLGNETYAYADEFAGHGNSILAMQLIPQNGAEMMSSLGPINPIFSGSENYTPYHADASPVGNYVVLQLLPNDSNPPQLGSFTVDSSGQLSSTNTPSDMPTSSLIPSGTSFSPDGKMFAIGGNANDGAGNLGNGVEIYDFNGASPLTLHTRLLNGTPIDQVAWDTSGHLYALSHLESKLWVYSVTASSVALDAVVSISSPMSMVVVSKTASSGGCAAPTGDGISICSPSEGAMMNSPVQINATAAVSGGVYRFEVWSGSTKLVSSSTNTINQSISLAPGTYTLKFDAYNSGKTSHEYATRDITVQ